MSMIHLIHTSAHSPAGGAGLTPSWLAEDEWQGHCETAHLQGNTETLPSPSVMVATYNMYIWNFRWLVLYNVMHLLAYPKIRRKYPYPPPPQCLWHNQLVTWLLGTKWVATPANTTSLPFSLWPTPSQTNTFYLFWKYSVHLPVRARYMPRLPESLGRK